MKRKLLKSIALLLFMGMSSVFCVNSVYADFFDDYEFINCPDGMLFDYIIINCPGNLAYDPVVDACVPEAENDGKGLVCVIKKIKTGEIKFACDPKGEKDNCRTDSWGHELSCPNATIVIPN